MHKQDAADTGRMHPVSLHFTPDLEKEFRENFARRNRIYAPVAYGSALLMYSLYAFLDWIIVPERIGQLLLVRLGISLPVLLGILVLLALPAARRFMQPLLALAGISASFAINGLMLIGWPELHVYFFGVIVVNLYVQVFGRLLFAWATTTSCLNVVIFLGFMQLAGASFEQYAVSLFFIFSTLFLGVIVGWSTERLWRILFLRGRNLVQTNEVLRASSQTDPLTGLLNRRGMLEALQIEHSRLGRSGRGYVIALLDLDHFKRINDTWGHECGDAVLKEIAEHFRATLRNTDVVSRWGGEEFLFLLPDSGLAGGRILVEKVRRHIANTPFMHKAKRIPVTVTAGVCEADFGLSITQVLSEADNALYEGKRNGRNQTCVRLSSTQAPENLAAAGSEGG